MSQGKDEVIHKLNSQKSLKQIDQKEENILVIDRFEGDLAVCENRKTRGNC